MPLSQLFSIRPEVSLDIHGFPIKFKYRQDRYTNEIISNNTRDTLETLEYLLDSWDLVDDTGEIVEGSSVENPLPVPINVECLRKLPLVVTNEITQAMMDDQNPNLKKRSQR